MHLLSRADQIAEVLREEITSLQREPGSALVRSELIDLFGTSSTPLREAIMRLEQEDLVRVYPQHATRITRINLGAARRVQFQRRAMDLEVIEQHCLAPIGGMVELLRDEIVKQRAAVEAMDLAALVVLDDAFHRLLYDAFDLAPLLDNLRQMSGHMNRVRRLALPDPNKPKEIVDQHESIVDAIAACDISAARAATRAHLTNSLAAAEQLRMTRPEIFEG